MEAQLSGEELDRYFHLEDEIITHEFCCNRNFLSIGRIRSSENLKPGHLLFDWQDKVVALKRGQCIPSSEAEIMRRIGTHPHIIQLIAEVDGGILMEGVEKGLTLDKYCYYDPNKTALDLETCVTLMKQVASALKHLHDINIIHHDLTPMNILIDLSHKVPVLKLCDFGISEIADKNGHGSEENRTAGRNGYMAPEQNTKSNKPITTKIDIYAFSSIAMSILSEGRSFHEVQYKVPIKLQNLLSGCRKKDPNKRPTINKILEVLDDANLAGGKTYHDLISVLCQKYQENNLPTPKDLEELMQTCSLNKHV